MTQSLALLLTLVVMAGMLGVSFLVVWGIAKQISIARDKAHVEALRQKAARLAKAGYLEAAQHFQDYAKQLQHHLSEHKSESMADRR